MLKKCLQNKTFAISVAILLPILIVTLIGPFIAPSDPLAMDSAYILKSSAPGHLLGTDNFGRDILSRLIWGIRPTMAIALTGTGIAFFCGLILGMIAGFLGKAAEQLIMRIMDIILCFPPILLAMMVVAFWGPGIPNLIAVIGTLYTPQFARIAYSSTLQIREMEYVESEYSLGATTFRILRRDVVPNILSPMIIQISLTIAAAILLESGLSFLGIGIVPPTPSWGQMIGEAKGYITIAPMFAFWPSLCLCITILAINLLGDSLRDILDPKLRT